VKSKKKEAFNGNQLLSSLTYLMIKDIANVAFIFPTLLNRMENFFPP
jgi:hypothetical protein